MHNFRKALLSALAVVLCVVFLGTAAAAPYFCAHEEWWQDAEDRKAYAGEIDTIACGTSEVYRAFVPELYDALRGADSYNIACSYMTIFGCCDMLKAELARNPVNTVILEVSYDTLTRNRRYEGPEGDIYQLGRCDGLWDGVRYFFKAVQPKEYAQVCYHLINRGLSGWKYLLKNRFDISRERTKVWGSFPTEDVSLSAQEMREIFASKPLKTTAYDENRAYFEECVRMSFEKGARVVLVTPPLPDRFLLENTGFDTVLGWYRGYAEQYGLELYDFNLLPDRKTVFPEDTAYSDMWHLSTEGADSFTRLLAELMDAHDRGEDTSGLFLASYEEAVTNAVKTY